MFLVMKKMSLNRLQTAAKNVNEEENHKTFAKRNARLQLSSADSFLIFMNEK